MTNKILFVEDEIELAYQSIQYLEDKGFDLTYARNGKEAIIEIERDKFDLIISDILMPEMDGIELAIQLQKTKNNTKLLIISGGGRIDKEHYLLTAKRFGVKNILAKPFTLNQLHVSVIQALAE